MGHLRQVQAAQCFVQHSLDIHSQITKIPFSSRAPGIFKIIVAVRSALDEQGVFMQRATGVP